VYPWLLGPSSRIGDCHLRNRRAQRDRRKVSEQYSCDTAVRSSIRIPQLPGTLADAVAQRRRIMSSALAP
jgi:hypothetical protein